jgi:NNP family nitrate/nitrite transporter-like MFS transporter
MATPTTVTPVGTVAGPTTINDPVVPLAATHSARGRWIDRWDPEDPTFWADGGRRIAQRNLAASVFAEFLGFAVWAVWSIVVPQLPAAGFTFSVDEMFWLIAVPSLVGATLRIPYTFAVPRFGGRNWTIVSALLLLLPASAIAWAVQRPGTPFGVMLAIAALAGVGGGNFASSMANISFFYPAREKGTALGLNAAGGNLGTAAVQFAVPLVIGAGAGLSLERAGLMFIPFVLLAAFIGYSGAFPTLLKGQFPEVTASIAFLGALGGFLIPRGFAMSTSRTGGLEAALWVFIGLYVLMSVVAWAVYHRRGAPMAAAAV